MPATLAQIVPSRPRSLAQPALTLFRGAMCDRTVLLRFEALPGPSPEEAPSPSPKWEESTSPRFISKCEAGWGLPGYYGVAASELSSGAAVKASEAEAASELPELIHDEPRSLVWPLDLFQAS